MEDTKTLLGWPLLDHCVLNRLRSKRRESKQREEMWAPQGRAPRAGKQGLAIGHVNQGTGRAIQAGQLGLYCLRPRVPASSGKVVRSLSAME